MPVRAIQKKWALRAVLFPWEIGGYIALAVLIAVIADGLAWALAGFAEQIEFLETRSDEELATFGRRKTIDDWMLEAARATLDEVRARRPA